MEKIPPNVVVDASVGVKWYSTTGEDDTEKAVYLRERHLNQDTEIIVPDLFFYEVVNALRYNPSFKRSHLGQICESLIKMELAAFSPTAESLAASSNLALEKAITIYDATYIALAQSQNALFITADNKLCKKCKDIQELRFLTDI